MISVANNPNKNWGEKIQKNMLGKHKIVTIVNFPTLKKKTAQTHTL